MKEPKFRFVTVKAIEKLTEELNFEVKTDLQDWEFIIGNYQDIEKYISHYQKEIDDDKKFALMEIIIQALTEQNEENLKRYWQIVRQFLIKNFDIHQYSIFYWCCFDNENLEDCWQITPYMRTLWKERNGG
jgi:hypothetical protein